MARMKTPPELVRVKLALAEPLCLCEGIFSELGGAGNSTIPEYLGTQLVQLRKWGHRSWRDPVEGHRSLRCGAIWLLSGEGSRFRNGQIDQHETEASTTRTTSTETALNLLRLALRMLEDSEAARLKLDGRRWGHSSVGGEPNAGPSPAPASPIIQ